MFLILETISILNASIASNNSLERNGLLISILIVLLIVAILVTAFLIYIIYFKRPAKESSNASRGEGLNVKLTTRLTVGTETQPTTANATNISGNGNDKSRNNKEIVSVRSPNSTVEAAKPANVSPTNFKAIKTNTVPNSPPPSNSENKSKPEVAKIPIEDKEPTHKNLIGYTPSLIFQQPDPYVYPYVLMPKSGSLAKYPVKGRAGRKGYTEERFLPYLQSHFNDHFQIHNNHALLIKNKKRPYEPDFTLIDNREGKNILVDIEIDEPYEGINDINARQPTHYTGSDTERNHDFTKRGWIVIRFAEIQIHQNPIACCLYIANVIRSINSEFNVPEPLRSAGNLLPIRQWTKQEAKLWSDEKQREKYLGITNFGSTIENSPVHDITETEDGQEIEDLIQAGYLSSESAPNNLTQYLVKSALYEETYLRIKYQGQTTIIKPLDTYGAELAAYCFIRNMNVNYLIDKIESVSIKSKYYIERQQNPSLEQTRRLFNEANNSSKFVRIRYASAPNLNHDTGELVAKAAKYYTITKMKPVQDGIKQNNQNKQIRLYKDQHFEALNHTSYSTLTLRFDRISEIETLDL